MTAVRTQVALNTVRVAHNVVQTEDRRAVLLALKAAQRAGNPRVCFWHVAEVALRKSMGIHPDAFLTTAQSHTVRDMAAPFINERLVVIARRCAMRSSNAQAAILH